MKKNLYNYFLKMKALLKYGLCFVFLAIFNSSFMIASPTNGPLRVHPNNPTCMVDASGNTVITTGTHTWDNFQDDDGWGIFDYDQYINMMVSTNENFMRMWLFQLYDWKPEPYLKSGDKYDLNQFNPDYFNRLRTRVQKARDNGIYVMICLFWGHASWDDRFARDYFNGNNNVNGVDGHSGNESQTLVYPDCTQAQENYVKRIIDEIGDFDNVLFEVANEPGDEKQDWESHIIDVIKDYERNRTYQHLTAMEYNGIKFPPGNFEIGLPADNRDNPSIWPQDRITILDTDHSEQGNSNPVTLWKYLLRGGFPIQMDCPGAGMVEIGYAPKATDWTMGDMVRLSSKINRELMHPNNAFCSTGYCLKADDGTQFVAYNPDGGSFTVDMSESSGKSFATEWYSVDSRTFSTGSNVNGGNSSQNFNPPFSGPAVLLLKTGVGGSSGVAVNGVSISPTNSSVGVGSSLSLTATVSPSNASNHAVSWTSDNTSVATVSGGTVTGVTPGTATITVATNDGSYTATSVVTVTDVNTNTDGNGLKGDYYNTMDLSGSLALSRIDPTVNFDWGEGSYTANQNSDGFSVRWTGQVQAQYTETYTFYTTTDDGVRLSVNGTQLIDDWVDQGPSEMSGSTALTAGNRYDIQMEYYENGGGAVAQLSWSSPGTEKSIIPQSRLYSSSAKNALSDDATQLSATKTNKISVYPNPSYGGKLTILGVKGETQVGIFNVQGQEVYRNRFNAINDITINGLSLNKGIYIIRISNEGNSAVNKLIIR